MQAARQARSSCLSVTRILITHDFHCNLWVMAEGGCSLRVCDVKQTCLGCQGLFFCAERRITPRAALSLSGLHVLLQEPWAREQQRPPQSIGRCAHG